MKKTVLMLALATATIANAQFYNLTHFQNTYVPLSNAIMYTDDPEWIEPSINIQPGFEVKLGEESYSELSQLGGGAEWGSFSFNTVAMMGFGHMLASGSNIEGAEDSPIEWKTEGNAGSRILKIQYTNAAFLNEVFSSEGTGSANNRISFQIWFYEADGAIEYRVGPSNITDPELVFDGEQGPKFYLAGDINFETGSLGAGAVIGGTPNAPILTHALDLFDIFFTPGLSAMPSSGSVYRLAPATLNIEQPKEAGFSVYPTVTSSALFIKTDLKPNSNYGIYSATGQLADAGVLNSNTLNVSSLARGIYFLQLDGEERAVKFIKQ